MTLKESSLFIALIKISYPTAYRDIDENFAKLTVEMWHSEFAYIPYQVMQMALVRYRRKSKFAPTIAEIIEEIKDIYDCALIDYLSARSVDEIDKMEKSKRLMDATKSVAEYERQETDRFYHEDLRLLDGF